MVSEHCLLNLSHVSLLFFYFFSSSLQTALLLSRPPSLSLSGMYGQLGHGSTEKQTSPKVVEDLSDDTVYLLACGNFHTVRILAFFSF